MIYISPSDGCLERKSSEATEFLTREIVRVSHTPRFLRNTTFSKRFFSFKFKYQCILCHI